MSFAVARRSAVSTVRSSSSKVSNGRRSVVSVRAEAPTPTPGPSSTPTPTGAPPTPMASAPIMPPKPVAPKPPSLADAMAFSGPAPETINGRLAMLGFFAAAGAELSTGTTVLDQLAAAPVPILATFAIFAAASFIPMLQGAKGETIGPFNPAAEMLNGRAAMIGLVALLAYEAVNGSALL